MALLLPLLLLSCAMPHRAARVTHELRTYQGRSDGLISIATWTDSEKGGGVFLLTDPEVQTLSVIHTNQTALGGGSIITAGPMSLKVDPQTGAIIAATGTAVGNVVGAAVKAATR